MLQAFLYYVKSYSIWNWYMFPFYCKIKHCVFVILLQIRIFYGAISIAETKLVCDISRKFILGWKTYLGGIGGPKMVPKWSPTPLAIPGEVEQICHEAKHINKHML